MASIAQQLTSTQLKPQLFLQSLAIPAERRFLPPALTCSISRPAPAARPGAALNGCCCRPGALAAADQQSGRPVAAALPGSCLHLASALSAGAMTVRCCAEPQSGFFEMGPSETHTQQDCMPSGTALQLSQVTAARLPGSMAAMQSCCTVTPLDEGCRPAVTLCRNSSTTAPCRLQNGSCTADTAAQLHKW